MDRNTEMILFENVMDAKETVGWMIANATSGYNLELLFEKGVDFKTIRKVLIENQKRLIQAIEEYEFHLQKYRDFTKDSKIKYPFKDTIDILKWAISLVEKEDN